MRKKDYLEQLRKLLEANLAKADADDAYAYYTELFDEEEFGTLVERIGTPEDVVPVCWAECCQVVERDASLPSWTSC